VAVLLGILGLAFYPSVHAAWSASPQITPSLDGSGNTVLTIQFDFSQMSSPPTSSHYPTAFQVRTSTDGMSWTELPTVPISTIPATTVFTETYNLGSVSGTTQVQARLNCNIHGWSDWGPNPAVPAPEFPIGTIPVTLLLIVIGSLFLFRRKLAASA
jgi:hypothetical protein